MSEQQQKELSAARSAHAKEFIDGLGEGREAALALAVRLPGLVRNNGLGQTLAFLQSRENEENGHLSRAVSQWLSSRLQDTTDDILTVLTRSDSRFLRWATRETLAYLECLCGSPDAAAGEG